MKNDDNMRIIKMMMVIIIILINSRFQWGDFSTGSTSVWDP